MQKYLAMFIVYNGECMYRIPIGFEEESIVNAKQRAKTYEEETNDNIWKLESITEIKTLEELWNIIR